MAEPAGVDVHAHFFPESFIRIIEESGGTFGASVDRSNPKGPVLVVGSARTAPLDARYWDLDLRLRAMNRQGVATQALSLTAPMVTGPTRPPARGSPPPGTTRPAPRTWRIPIASWGAPCCLSRICPAP